MVGSEVASAALVSVASRVGQRHDAILVGDLEALLEAIERRVAQHQRCNGASDPLQAVRAKRHCIGQATSAACRRDFETTRLPILGRPASAGRR